MDVLHHTVLKIRIMKNKEFYLFWNSHGRLGVDVEAGAAFKISGMGFNSLQCTDIQL